MHLHESANRHVRKNARCKAAMQIGDNTAVILRCSPFFTASLEGWVTSARGHPSRRRASARLLRMTGECMVDRNDEF
jgi:hypothetical protein